MPPTVPQKKDRKIVVAALAVDRVGRVLLSRRRASQPMGGLWELPGGKVESGEAPAQALVREVSEELACGCLVGDVYDVVHYDYPGFELFMVVYRVELVGEPIARDVEAVTWVPPAELGDYEVLPADVELLAAIAKRGRVERSAPPESLTPDPRVDGVTTKYFQHRLAEELDRAARYDRPISIVLVAVDELPANDGVLSQWVGLMTRNARAIDCVGRAGGGGFVLLLPETPAGAAFGIAESLRADVAALGCTISCGVASRQGGASTEDSLVARAEAALRRAKSSGGNRTVVDSP